MMSEWMTHVNPRVYWVKSNPKVSYFFLLVHFDHSAHLDHNIWKSAHSFTLCPIWVLYYRLRCIWKNFLYWVKLIELQRLLKPFHTTFQDLSKRFCVFKARKFFLTVQNVYNRTCTLYVIDLILDKIRFVVLQIFALHQTRNPCERNDSYLQNNCFIDCYMERIAQENITCKLPYMTGKVLVKSIYYFCT